MQGTLVSEAGWCTTRSADILEEQELEQESTGHPHSKQILVLVKADCGSWLDKSVPPSATLKLQHELMSFS